MYVCACVNVCVCVHASIKEGESSVRQLAPSLNLYREKELEKIRQHKKR